MKKLNLTYSVIVMALLMGCSTSEKIKTGSVQYIQDVQSISSEKSEPFVCIKSVSAIEKFPWKKQIKNANACVKSKSWSTVKFIGAHLAKTEANSPWGAYYLSLEAEYKSQYPRSLWMIEAALKKVPSQPILLYQKGRLLWKMGNYEAGVQTMEEALRRNSKMISAKLFLAKVELRDQQYSKAYELFKSVAQQFPSTVEAHVGVAECLTQKESWNDAVISWEKAIELEPRRIDYRLRRVRILDEKIGNVEKSLASYQKIKYLKNKKRLVGKLPSFVEQRISKLEVIMAEQTIKKVSQRKPAQNKKVSE